MSSKHKLKSIMIFILYEIDWTLGLTHLCKFAENGLAIIFVQYFFLFYSSNARCFVYNIIKYILFYILYF